MASSSSSSSSLRARLGITMLILVVVAILGSDYGVEGKFTCSGRKVKRAYIADVNELVQKLQQKAPYDPKKKAKLTVGSVTGKASCDRDDVNDCLGCLAVATGELAHDCRGRASGSSDGISYCYMSFGPA